MNCYLNSFPVDSMTTLTPQSSLLKYYLTMVSTCFIVLLQKLKTSNSPQEISHNSFLGGSEKNGCCISYECNILHKPTHCYKYVLIYQSISQLTRSWQIELCWQTFLQKRGRERRSWGKWWSKSWGSSERWGERSTRIRQRGETTSCNTRQNETCLPVICHTL